MAAFTATDTVITKQDFMDGLTRITTDTAITNQAEKSFDDAVATGILPRNAAGTAYLAASSEFSRADDKYYAAINQMEASARARTPAAPAVAARPTPATVASRKVGSAVAAGRAALSPRPAGRGKHSAPPPPKDTPRVPRMEAATPAPATAPAVATAPTMSMAPPAPPVAPERRGMPSLLAEETAPTERMDTWPFDSATVYEPAAPVVDDDSVPVLNGGWRFALVIVGIVGFFVGLFNCMPVVGDKFYGNNNPVYWLIGTFFVIAFVVLCVMGPYYVAKWIVAKLVKRHREKYPVTETNHHHR